MSLQVIIKAFIISNFNYLIKFREETNLTIKLSNKIYDRYTESKMYCQLQKRNYSKFAKNIMIFPNKPLLLGLHMTFEYFRTNLLQSRIIVSHQLITNNSTSLVFQRRHVHRTCSCKSIRNHLTCFFTNAIQQ